jgi:ChrR Cupin-like domain
MSTVKPALEFLPAASVEWSALGGGLSERILGRDEATGIHTRMLRFERGTSTVETLTHDFWEEVWIVEGAITDRRLGKTFGAGTYACRPPGMEHGPWDSPGGCVTFEVRYPAPFATAGVSR